MRTCRVTDTIGSDAETWAVGSCVAPRSYVAGIIREKPLDLPCQSCCPSSRQASLPPCSWCRPRRAGDWLRRQRIPSCLTPPAVTRKGCSAGRPISRSRARVSLEGRFTDSAPRMLSEVPKLVERPVPSCRLISARLLQDPALDRKSQPRITRLHALVYNACNEGMIGD